MKAVRRRALAALAALLGGLASATTAQAQDKPPRAFAVVSEMAREISVVTFQESTGSRLGANMRSRIAIPEGTLDKAALFAARSTLQRAAPGAAVWLMAPLDSDLFGTRQSAAEGELLALPADLAAEMKARGTTHLLLMQRFRGEAQLQAMREFIGTGQLDGVGLYVDRTSKMTDGDSGAELGRGYIAPYLYLRLSIVDPASGRVLRTQVVKDSRVIASVDGAAGVHPWDFYSPAQKVQMIHDGMVGAIERVVPELVAGP